jgi:WD40 repeat protein
VDEASRKAVGTAQASFARGDSRAGLAYMAEALRYRPENERVRLSASSYLVQTPVVAPLPVGTPTRRGGAVDAPTFSPDGRKVLRIGVGDEAPGIWDIATGDVAALPEDTRSGAFSADGRWVVTLAVDNAVRLWDAASGRDLGVRLSEDAPVTQASFSPDGRWISTTSGETARVWNAAIGREIAERIRQEDPVNAASFSGDGRWLVTAGDDGIARVWDAASGQPNGPPILVGGVIAAAGFSADGRLILTTAADGAARAWDPASGHAQGPPVRSLSSANPLARARFSPDGRRVITIEDRTVRVWDTTSGKPVGEPLEHGGAVRSAAFSADGKRVVTASADGTARVWETATGRPATPPFRHRAAVETAAFSADGRWLVTGCADGTAGIWDVKSGETLGAAMKHEGAVIAASFSPDGRLLVTAADSGDRAVVQLWRAPSGAPIGGLIRHGGPFVAAGFSPDSRLVLTASGDGMVRTWGTVFGRQLGAPMTHDGVRAASFSADGRWIVTAGADGVVRMWEVPRPEPARDAYLAFESIGGQRVSDDGLLVDIPLEERISMRGRLRALGSGEWNQLVHWYVADPRTRTVSPHASITVPEHVEREIAWVLDHPDAPDSRRILDAAYELDPSHPLILFALAALNDTPQPARDLYVKLGLDRVPADARTCARAVEILRTRLGTPDVPPRCAKLAAR